MSGFDISVFPITSDSLNKFRRWVKKPRDCVINALEVIGVLDQTNADLMRIAVGDMGLVPEQIAGIFEYMSELAGTRFSYRFFRYTDINTLSNVCAHMPINSVIFCGYNKNNFKHVFLIGKNSVNDLVYIDAQYGKLCSLKSDPHCFDIINNAQEYYILQYADTSMKP